jgi:hypothetical protein
MNRSDTESWNISALKATKSRPVTPLKCACEKLRSRQHHVVITNIRHSGEEFAAFILWLVQSHPSDDVSCELQPPTDLLLILQMMYEYWEPRRNQEKTCPSATLSTTNSTRPDAGANPVLCGERPATNRLSHGKAPLQLNTILQTCYRKQVDILLNTHFLQGANVADGCGHKVYKMRTVFAC